MEMSTLVITDGGRAEAGFSTAADAGDCFVRAVAVAMDLPYAEVYADVARWSAARGGRKSGRDGVSNMMARDFMQHAGWTWVPVMGIGSGCTMHLRTDELPSGRLIARVSKHFVAVIDGTVYDNHDPRRNGARCVYGYWEQP